MSHYDTIRKVIDCHVPMSPAKKAALAALETLKAEGRLFTADEMKAAYMEAFERASFDVSGGHGSNRFGRWADSTTFKLIQERTK